MAALSCFNSFFMAILNLISPTSQRDRVTDICSGPMSSGDRGRCGLTGLGAAVTEDGVYTRFAACIVSRGGSSDC